MVSCLENIVLSWFRKGFYSPEIPAKYSPTLELAFKIAEVFQVPLDQVFQYTPPKIL